MAWNGCMALPRVLTIGPDGHPRQTPAEEIEILHGERHSPPDTTLDGGSMVLDVRGDALEFNVCIEPAGATFSGLRVRRSDDGQDGVVIGYDGESVWVGGIEIPYVLSEGQDALKLRVFLDKSVIEVFVDDGTRVASNFIDCGANDLGIELFARGGAAAFRSIDIWEMESIR